MADFKAATTKKVAILVAPGLEEIEALAPLDVLWRAGVPTDLVSITRSREVTSSHNVVVTCNRTLDEASLEDYDMLVLPGGIPGMPNLRGDSRVIDAVSARVKADRPVAAICASPSILAGAGLITGRRATANPGFVNVLEENDVEVSEDAVVVDGNLITSRGMATATDFGLEIVRHYLGDEAVEEVKKKIVYQG